MSFIIDTDTCSAYLKGDARVFNRFLQHGGGLHISILTLAELYSWVYIANDPTSREAVLSNMVSEITVLPIDDEIARRCGEIRGFLQRRGTKVPTVDMLIATTALVHDLTIVTHNQRHFSRVPDLRIQDWLP